ncbi:MAG: ATP-grasp domain-containing protein [Ktedonobacteraceae bacterium]|nr:ATP-grasp domain-containing protein [Ktedonobacteraceae bacterium]
MKDSLEEDLYVRSPLVEQQLTKVQQAKGKVTYDALVLDAKLRQSLVTIRSLGRRGMPVAAVEIASLIKQSSHVPTFASRWCHHAYIAPAYEESTHPFVEYLLQLLDDTGVRVLITSSDGTLAVLREHRQELEKRVRLALAQEPALALALNKDQTLQMAEQLGLGVPRGVMIKTVSELAAALREIGLPAVIKPVASWVWGEQHGQRLVCQLVTTADEARLAVEQLTQDGAPVLLQQFLSGKREAVSLLYAHGQMYARFAQWAKRTQPPLGGSSVYRQSIALPEDIGQQAERLVREMALEGYSEVEFRRDSVGKPYLMEVNPRLSASVEVAVRAGVDFPYLLYQWANGDRIERVPGYQVGGWMRYLEGDLLTTAQTFTQRGRPGVTPPAQALLEFCTDFLTPSGYDYLDWQDLRPVWVAVAESIDRLRQRLGKDFSKLS